MNDNAEDREPLFKPKDLKRHLDETPKPLVIDVEALRMCSEQDELLANEVTRIVEKTTAHIRAVLQTMPIGRHLCLVTLRGLPGSFAIQSQHTPWGRGAGKIYQSIRGCIAQALTEEGMPAECVPDDEDVQLSFGERSFFRIYGTKWKEWKKEG